MTASMMLDAQTITQFVIDPAGFYCDQFSTKIRIFRKMVGFQQLENEIWQKFYVAF
jgi:hypothetical protein